MYVLCYFNTNSIFFLSFYGSLHQTFSKFTTCLLTNMQLTSNMNDFLYTYTSLDYDVPIISDFTYGYMAETVSQYFARLDIKYYT